MLPGQSGCIFESILAGKRLPAAGRAYSLPVCRQAGIAQLTADQALSF